MRSQAAPAMKARDKVRLERAFTQIATFAPPDYPQWIKLSEAGAAAARRGDVDEAEVACSDCHDTYRARYRAERRDRPIF